MAIHEIGPDLRAMLERIRAEELSQLTDEALVLLADTMPDYAVRGRISVADLRTNATRNLRHTIAGMLGEERLDQDPSSTTFYDTGRRRAQQGVPLESVLSTFRLGARLLWQALVRRITLDDARRTVPLLDQAVVIWDVMEVVSSLVALGYRDEQMRVRRQGQRLRESALATLFEAGSPSPEILAECAAVLGIPVRGAFLVATGTERHDDARREEPGRLLAALGLHSAWLPQGSRISGLISVDGPDRERAVLDALAGSTLGAVGLSTVVDDLGQVGGAFRQAALALRTVPGEQGGAALIADRLPEALLVASPEVSRLLVDHWLGGLVGAAESEKLYDTVVALVQANGSATEAAHRLYCHRNTVIKRVARLEALTGHDPGDLRTLLQLYLAVLATRLPTVGAGGVHAAQAAPDTRSRR